LENSDFDAFLGVEHGSLEAIKTAKRLGKKSVLVFQSPHHSFRKKWVDREQEKFPELFPSSSRRLLKLDRIRDARRDEEALLADFIHANSNVTAVSLIDAGIPEKKIKVLPLGSPPSIPDESLPTSLSTPLRFIYAGPISIRKGAHYLLKAWELLKPNRNAELHLYGVPLLPDSFLKNGTQNVIFHGSVSQKELSMAYQQAAILVFPSLCDGFGLVASEAMANGLPVITTKNAGVADFIKEGFNGFVVSPANAESLAKRLEWCIKNPDELLRMRPNALISARRWTWNEFRAEFRRQISDLLGISL
jgi:glycosyltransferase involved in cell wall biosynthesis